MNIEEIVAKFKEEGKTDEEIKAVLEAIKKDIDAFLGMSEGEGKKEELPAEEDKKMQEVFGV